MIKPGVSSINFCDTPPEQLQWHPKTLLELINLKEHK